MGNRTEQPAKLGLDIKIKSKNRITIIGGTGDGKTTLALKIAAIMKPRHTVIINPMAEDKYYDVFPDIPVRKDIDQTWPALQHVAPFVTQDYRKYGKLWYPILEHGNVLTLNDEIGAVSDEKRYSIGFKYLYQMGRRRNCGTIGISQRPRAIPPFVYQMADHLFVGDVLGDDLIHIEKLTSQPWRQAIQNRGQYEFLYWSRHTKQPPVLVKL